MHKGDGGYFPTPSLRTRFMGSHIFYQDCLQHTTPRSGPNLAMANNSNQFNASSENFYDRRSCSAQLDEKTENNLAEMQASIFKRHNEQRPPGSGCELGEPSFGKDQLFQVPEESYKSFSPGRSHFEEDSYTSGGRVGPGSQDYGGQNPHSGQRPSYQQRQLSISVDPYERSPD